MALGAYEQDERVLLRAKLQGEIFSKILQDYDWKLLTKNLNVSRGMLYHYKNGRTTTIPLRLMLHVGKMAGLSRTLVESAILKRYEAGSIKRSILAAGRMARHLQLKTWADNLPRAVELFENGCINIQKWWESYCKLINFGAHHIDRTSIFKENIHISHTCWSKGKRARYRLIIPSKIPIDDDFQYFLGLWCGDRVGGGRIGIANKCIKLISVAAHYLRRLHQKPQFVLLKMAKYTRLPQVPFSIDATYEMKKMPGDWVLCVQTVNGVLARFFHHIQKDLDSIIDVLPRPEIFFAGLFDAEGNVLFEDECFRWACKNMEKIEVYKKHLKRLGLFNRYDGSSMITTNKTAFAKFILPHLKHPDKINRASLVCYDRGHLDKRFYNILYLVSKNQGETVANLATLAGKVKLWPQIHFLEKHNYLKARDYPKRMFLTSRGFRELEREGRLE